MYTKEQIKQIVKKFIQQDLKKKDILDEKIFDMWKVRTLTQQEFIGLMKNDALMIEHLIYFSLFGLLAPTSHNTIPQRFQFIPEKQIIEILIDRQYILPHSDATGRQALVSIGCVLQNIEKVANEYGCEVVINYDSVMLKDLQYNISMEKRYLKIATATFKYLKKMNPNFENLEILLARKVVRAEYDETVVLEQETIEMMQKYVSQNYKKLSLHVVTNKMFLTGFAKIQEIADRTVIELDSFSRELGNWLLSNEDVENNLGMRGREFGFDDRFSNRIHDGLQRKVRLLPDEIAGFAIAGKMAIKKSSALCILTMKETSTQSYIDAGMAYEYISLDMQQNGYCNAMHAGMTEVTVAARMLGASLRTIEKPAVIFRIGKPLKKQDYDRPHSSRPSLEDVVLYFD
ncbi:MAG: hypothetical protein WCO06_02660 [Candidatus Roizmanbacteria bacterium]